MKRYRIRIPVDTGELTRQIEAARAGMVAGLDALKDRLLEQHIARRDHNRRNAGKPRKRKLPTSAVLIAELGNIISEQGATEDEARAILHTRYSSATPQAINKKLRQKLSDR